MHIPFLSLVWLLFYYEGCPSLPSKYTDHPIVPWIGWTVPRNPSIHSYIPYPTVHPILLYHGRDGQYHGIQVSIHIYLILLSILSYCTMDGMDSTRESKYPLIYTLSYCPSYPIVPWTGWTVPGNPSIHSYIPYPTVHPILLYHGRDGQYHGIQVSIHIYLILLSILSYCTMDGMDSTRESKYPFIYTLSYCPSYPIVPWTGWTVPRNPSIHSYIPYPTVHPILLYHGRDGQYHGIQVSIHIYLILLSILSYCTMDGMDSTTESKYPFIYTLSYCPSYPIVPWTGWTVPRNPSIHSYIPYPTVHPILLYHGRDGQYHGIQVSIHIYLILLSILSYCTMDGMDSTTESKYPFIYILSYCPSYPIVPWTEWTVPGNPSIHSYTPYPTVHPILLYHGRDGQYHGIQVSIHIYLILLSILSYCTMDGMDSTTESKYPFIYTLSYCPSYPIVPWKGWTVPGNPSIQSYIPYPTVHPILLYHGRDGQYHGIQVSIHIYLILLSILSYCTMDGMDSTTESKYPFIYILSYCPSYPIVPWTEWTVPGNPSIHSYTLYPTVHPILLYHGRDGQYQGIQVSIHIHLILLSILSYCTMDGMDSTRESKYPFIYTLSYCPSYPIVPWTGWTVPGNPSIQSYIPYPTVHPILLYHGRNGQYQGIQVSIHIYLILLSILSYCTMDGMDSMRESNLSIQTYVDVATDLLFCNLLFQCSAKMSS